MSKRDRVGPVDPTPVIERDDAGDPEPSIFEVEQALKALDRADAARNEPAPIAPLLDDALLDAAIDGLRSAQHEIAAVGLPHALDLAPLNSKIVVVLEDNKPLAILAGPNGAHPLPAHDIAHRLPAGARITKHADDRYEATQLSPAEHKPNYTTTTASAAIAQFVDHFHPLGGNR